MTKTDGISTRSKTAQALAVGEDHVSDNTRVPKRSVRSHSSRSSREAARLRAEYEAEKEIAKVKEGLIKKKLALDIAEIEDEFEDEIRSTTSRAEEVRKWLGDGYAAANPPAGEAACAEQWKVPETPRAAAPFPHSAYDAEITCRTKYIAPTDDATPTDIKHLAKAIMSLTREKYDLPEFDGNPVDWLSYRRAFENTAQHYSMEQNIVRLQKTLRGPAKRSKNAYYELIPTPLK